MPTHVDLERFPIPSRQWLFQPFNPSLHRLKLGLLSLAFFSSGIFFLLMLAGAV